MGTLADHDGLTTRALLRRAPLIVSSYLRNTLLRAIRRPALARLPPVTAAPEDASRRSRTSQAGIAGEDLGPGVTLVHHVVADY